MDDIVFYNQEADKALAMINETLENKLTDLDFQTVVAKKLGYDRENSTRIASHHLTAEKMIDLLDDDDLGKPTELSKVTFYHSILPDDVPGRLDEKVVKVKGEIWSIHKYDKDPCPSNPHAHNIETGYKLHLGTGELYNYKCNPLNKKIKRKHLLAIRDQLGDITLPTLTV